MERMTPNQPASGESSDASRRGYGPEDTLWCLHCSRTFPGRDARPDPYFGREGCGYDCDAAGFDIEGIGIMGRWRPGPRCQPLT